MKENSIVFTNEHCIGCNKCIKACSAIGACISQEADGRARIVVDGSKCVLCGSCIDVCEHNAREFEDDTERFFADLKKGEHISLLLAPAFKANYPDRYDEILGGLKSLGADRIISVSFGADITTWGYLNYIRQHDFKGGISQPCPAVVGYIERYLPELLPKLFPVQSPLMCAAIYARKKLGVKEKLAFISPCIAKKMEIEDPHNEGLVQYNVTFEHLLKFVDEHGIKGAPASSEIEYGLGSFYPTPGGLAENVRWFLGDEVFIRQIEGEKRLYEWLHQNTDRIRDGQTPFLLIDALNCEKGCICGTAVDSEKSKTDDALYALLKIREESKKAERGSAWSRKDSPEERLESYNKQFEGLELSDYLRGYTDRSKSCTYEIPNEEQLEEIFCSMNKTTEESRQINCTCCGYDSCTKMAIAIHNGFNHKENCIYFEKTMVHKLEVENAITEGVNKAQGEFLSNMSHEIRTPINAVLGMDEMILMETNEEKTREYASNIKVSGQELMFLVNTLLDFKTQEQREDEKKHHHKVFRAPNASILAVDDTEMNLTVVKGLLKNTDILIDTAGSAEEALGQIRAKTYDILIFDHMMPEKDGIELLHEVRAMESNPNSRKPCIVLTANAVPGARETYLAEGFDEYMSKPVDGKALERMLMRFLPADKVLLKEGNEESDGKAIDEDILERYSGLEGIDVLAGIRNCGSEEAYHPVLEIFYKSIDSLREELEDYFASGQWGDYTIKVHALKSSARIIGAMELGESAMQLEAAGKGGDIDFIRANHGKLMAGCRELEEKLCRFFDSGKEEEPEKPVVEEELLASIYRMIQRAAEEMEYDAIEQALERIGGYSLPEADQRVMDAVREAFEDIDYDGVLLALEQRQAEAGDGEGSE
ncbi:MAG: response regulator [Lachnospiraceae bacterium]|nr:response regulator [Lachnospiraceae bacterium]